MKLLFAVLWLILITVLLTLPGSAFPKENWLNEIWMDKWIHVFLFAVLVFLWAKVVGKIYPIMGLLAIIYGIGMEYIQLYFVKNRSFDVGDILADSAGALIGTLIFWYRYKKNKPL